MKKSIFFTILSMVILGSFGCTNSNSDTNVPDDPDAYSSADLVGSWYRTYTNSSDAVCVEVWYFGENKIGGFADTNESNPIDFTFNWSINGDILTISNSGGTIEMQIARLTSNELTLILDNQRYNYIRYNPEENDNPETPVDPNDYAPSDVTNYKFTFTWALTHHVYFTSNYSVNSSISYYNAYPRQTITSGTYTKTANNKATMTLEYDNKSSRTFYLTFTSPTSGTLRTDGDLTDTKFSCEYMGSGETASAPSSIAYKKFSTGTYSWSDWFQFGTDYGTSVEITNYSGSVTYQTIYATYSRNSSTTATLVIYSKLGSYASLIAYTYDLSFLTSTSGTYTMRSNNSFDTSTHTGEFTLE